MEKPRPPQNPQQPAESTYTDKEGRTIRVIPEARRKRISIDTVGGGWVRPRSGRTSVQIAHHLAERPVFSEPEQPTKRRHKRRIQKP